MAWVSPPRLSTTISCCSSSLIDLRVGSASGLSILLIATMIGAPAALACWMASMVWGMTPSSAATTRTTMSVTLAPRARMAEKAAWPGVSRKVTALAVFQPHLIGADVLGDAAVLRPPPRRWSAGRRAARSCRGRRGP